MALNPVSCNIQPLVRRCVAIFMVPYELIELDFRFMQLAFIYYCAVLLLDGVLDQVYYCICVGSYFLYEVVAWLK
jgi:hypothetical protein